MAPDPTAIAKDVFNHLAPEGSGSTAGLGLVGGLMSVLVIKLAADASMSICSEEP